MRSVMFVIALVGLAVWALPAQAQVAVATNVGWNGGVRGDLEDLPGVTGSDEGLLLGGAIYHGHFGQEGKRQRWGISAATQLVELQLDAATADFRAVTVQLETERLVMATRKVELIWGVAAGFVNRSAPGSGEDLPLCVDDRCGTDEFNWVLTPVVRANLKLSSRVLLSGQVRGNIYTSSEDDSFPYKSGVVLLAGLEFRLPAGDGTNPVEVSPEPEGSTLR